MAQQYLPIDSGDFEKRLQEMDRRVDLLEGSGGTPPPTGDSGSNVLYRLEADTIDRTDLSRWNDNMNLGELAPIDPTGGTNNTHTALLKAWQKATARNRRSRVHIPAGTFGMGASVELLNDFLNSSRRDRLTFQGAGPLATTLRTAPNITTGGFKIGSYSHPTATGEVTFCDMTIAGGENNTGPAFDLCNARYCTFKRIRLQTPKIGWRFAQGASVGKTVVDIYITDCYGSVSQGGTVLYAAVSIDNLFVRSGEGKWNANGTTKFFLHDHPTYNCDGVYLTGGFFEDFDYYVDSIGGGLVNVEFQATQCDRATTFIRAQPASGVGSNRNWVVHDTQFLQCDEDALIFDGSGAGAIVEGIEISACNFLKSRKRVLYAPEGMGVMSGITMRSCGYGRTQAEIDAIVPPPVPLPPLLPPSELIRIGAAANWALGPMQAHRGLHDTAPLFPAYTNGIVYDGPSTAVGGFARRGHSNCYFWDGGQPIGTP